MSQRKQCTNCHQFVGAAAVEFCAAACAHQWSSRLLEAETPTEIWRIVELARSLVTPDATHRAQVIGKLIQTCREVWPDQPTTSGGVKQQ